MNALQSSVRNEILVENKHKNSLSSVGTTYSLKSHWVLNISCLRHFMIAFPCYFYQYFVPTGHYVIAQADSLKAKWYMITQYFRQAKAFNLQPSFNSWLCSQPNRSTIRYKTPYSSLLRWDFRVLQHNNLFFIAILNL